MVKIDISTGSQVISGILVIDKGNNMTAPNVMVTSSDIKALAGNQTSNVVGDLNVEGTFTIDGQVLTSQGPGVPPNWV